MATTLKQIMAELDKSGGYAADRKIINSQLQALPGQSAAEISGLDAKLGQANNQILEGARGRGLGFSGMPIEEQRKYAATEYAPAVARVKQSQNEKQLGYVQSLNGISRDQRSQAQSIYDTYRARQIQLKELAEQKRQFNKNLAFQKQQAAAQLAESRAARAAASSGGGGGYSFGGGSIGGGSTRTPSGVKASMVQRKGGGFNFSVGGKPVSAATYARLTGQQFRSVLNTMAKKGDAGAKQALGFVGNDYGYDPRKLNRSRASIYNALVWGSGRSARSGGASGSW